MIFFNFSDYWWFYLSFTGFVLFLLALDLGVFHRKAHEVSFKEASLWTLIWIALALIFNILFYFYALNQLSSESTLLANMGATPEILAKQFSLEFLTGYVVEKALAIDNIFVFAVIFSYFSVPIIYQHRILFYGIIGALIFRALFIALGSVLMEYQAVVIFFGLLLIFTGIKMIFVPTQEINPEKNIIIRILKKVLRLHPQMEGGSFFIRKNGLIYVTPLFIVLMFIEFSDIIFAVDSVPAIFALTKEPLIVFTSNIFAILGLRSMYFMLAGVMQKFIYIKLGLAGVLIFVGLKMSWLNEAFGGKFPITWSLAIIATLIGGSIAASLLIDHNKRIT